MVALGDVDPVLTIPHLDDVSSRVSDGRVILDSEMLESVDETALHVPALLSPHCSIDQPLSSSHCVEEELYRVQSIPITVIDEASWCSSHVSRFEEAESSSSVSPQYPLSTNRLLTHVCSHLPNVSEEPLAPALVIITPLLSIWKYWSAYSPATSRALESSFMM